MREKITSFIFLLAPLVLLTCFVGEAYGAPQSGRPDDTPSRPPVATPPKPRPPKSNPTKPPLRATLTVRVSPADSIVLLDNRESGDRDQTTGTLKFTDLRVMEHTLVVRREGYRDHSRRVDLTPGDNRTDSIELDPLPGSLSILPTLGEAEINVRNNGTNREVVRRVGSVDGLELSPGSYEISISKKGYQTLTRTLTVRPGQSIYLEPKLDPIESEKPRKRTASVVFVPASSSVEVEDKYLIVTLRGASGAPASAGSLIVAISQTGYGLTEVSGSLNGQPCAIEFVRLENVKEASVVESPGPSNQWSRVVVRVRPKDAKRVIRFAVNWRMLSGAPGVSPAGSGGASFEAEPALKAQSIFSATVRSVSDSANNGHLLPFAQLVHFRSENLRTHKGEL